MFKEKENIGFKGGFNLLDTYPLRFCNIVERVSSDGIPEVFQFRFPEQKIQHVIMNLCPTEPWALPNWIILEHKADAFLNKLKEIKARYFPEAKCYIAISKKEYEPVSAVKDYARNAEWMEVFWLNAKYPQDDPVMLSKIVLDLEISFGQDTTTQGVLILDAQTVSAIYENCILGNKVNSRFIALSGTGLKENEIVNVQLGTSLEKLLQNKIKESGKYRVFVNGPLHGREITDLSQKVDWSINNIVVLEDMDQKVMFPMFKPDELVLTTNMLGELRRCVYCNFCDDICPVDLESFICPSKLELLQIIKECKALDKQT
ncbi:MAG: hypothetical protein HYV59_03610 [Planctomycetes bacterium]|nr:hypothetical protein [Planctomycetota bacterium]